MALPWQLVYEMDEIAEAIGASSRTEVARRAVKTLGFLISLRGDDGVVEVVVNGKPVSLLAV